MTINVGIKKAEPIELVSRIQSGDKVAESELVKKYWNGLYFILKRRTADPQLAADLTQDAFIVVISKARNGEITTPEAIAGFIRQTGVNLMIGHYRKEKRRQTDTYGEVDMDIADQKSDITKSIEAQQFGALMRQLIDEMKVERDKDILNSFYVKEQDKSEICDRLELTSAHFDRVLFRARGRLKQLIQFKFGGNDVFD